MTTCEAPEIRIRAIAELHRIEMSLHSIFQELPHEQFQIRPQTIQIGQGPQQEEEKRHCYCHYCLPGVAEPNDTGPLVLALPTATTITSATVEQPFPKPKKSSPSDFYEEKEEEHQETESESERYWRMNPVSVSKTKTSNNNEIHYPRHGEEEEEEE